MKITLEKEEEKEGAKFPALYQNSIDPKLVVMFFSETSGIYVGAKERENIGSICLSLTRCFITTIWKQIHGKVTIEL